MTPIGLRQEIIKRIERKHEEIRELELRVRESRAYIQGIRDTLEVMDARESEGKDKP